MVTERANKHIAVTSSTQARFLGIPRTNRERDNEMIAKLLDRWFETGGYTYQTDRRRTRKADKGDNEIVSNTAPPQAVYLDVPEGDNSGRFVNLPS